ncbi:MAG: fimbrillin family protein [Bacteroidales bacterium]|nr:fimbrillin family protein [Bacteroidales bacterium]
MNKYNIYLAIAVLLLAGCGKELAPMGAEMTVEASVCALTKVSAAGDAFTAGDQIAVFAWLGSATQNPATRVVDGVVNTFDGTSWTPASQMRWQVTDDLHYFLGVSPVPTAAIADLTAVPYTLDPAKYAESDLLLATTPDGVKNTGAAVQLAFRHAMAKLSVNLKFRKQWATKPTVSAVTVSAQSTANVNYLTQTVTATGAALAVAVPEIVSVASGYDRSFSGLQVPQTGVRKITVTIDGKDFVYEAGEDITLAAGRNTTLNLAVGRDKIELEGISLAPWTAEDPLSEGEAVSANRYLGHGYVDMGEVTIGGVKKHLYWATCNIGAENPWDYGDYFDWGGIKPYYQAGHSQDNPCTDWIDGKDGYNWANYSFMQDGQSDWKHITKYTFADGHTDGTLWYDGGGNFIGDGKTSFAAYDYADDAARQIWGGNWRIPTDEEWTALRDDTLYDWVWTSDYLGDGSNHAGRIVTRKDGPCAGNSIFLPAAGYWLDAFLNDAGSGGCYWSSSLYEYYSDYAWHVGFYSSGVGRYGDYRYYGLSLRPVFCERYPLAAADVSSVDIGQVLAADGNIYADAAQATAAGTTAQAVIAYVGSVPNYFDKFLAIALEDTDGEMSSYPAATETVYHYAESHAITIDGTTYDSSTTSSFYDQVSDNVNVSSATRTSDVIKGWRLPSVTDWRYVFDGLGQQKAGLTLTAKRHDGSSIYSSNATPTDPLGVENSMCYYKDDDAEALRAAINDACGNTAWQSSLYWSYSSMSGDTNKSWFYSTEYAGFMCLRNYARFAVHARAVFAY